MHIHRRDSNRAGSTFVLRPAAGPQETANVLFLPYFPGAITFSQGNGRTVALGPFSGRGFAAGNAANGRELWGAHIARDVTADRTADWPAVRNAIGLRSRVDRNGVINPYANDDFQPLSCS